MEGGAGKRLALKEEISAVRSHKIPRAWEHTRYKEWNVQNKVCEGHESHILLLKGGDSQI